MNQWCQGLFTQISATRPHFYQTRSAWSVDQGSNKHHSPAYNFIPTVTKFCVMWEGLSLPHDTKFGNCRCKIVDSRSFPSWSLIHGLRWSGLIKVGPGLNRLNSPFVQVPEFVITVLADILAPIGDRPSANMVPMIRNILRLLALDDYVSLHVPACSEGT